MAVDLSKYDLSNADEFVAAAGEVAEHTADELGSAFSRSSGDDVFVNVKAITEYSKAATISGMLLMVTGDTKAAAEVLKFAVSLNAIVNEAKVRQGSN
jgi:hypothetical protein